MSVDLRVSRIYRHLAAFPSFGAEYDRSCNFDIRPKPKISFKKIRPSAEGISRSRRQEVSFSSPNSEVECIKYDILDFCNHLLVTANFPLENNMVLLW